MQSVPVHSVTGRAVRTMYVSREPAERTRIAVDIVPQMGPSDSDSLHSTPSLSETCPSFDLS